VLTSMVFNIVPVVFEIALVSGILVTSLGPLSNEFLEFHQDILDLCIWITICWGHSSYIRCICSIYCAGNTMAVSLGGGGGIEFAYIQWVLIYSIC